MKTGFVFAAALAAWGLVGPAEAGSDTDEAIRLARDAATAAANQDHATYLAKMEAAVALRPDYPRMLVNLAAAQAATGSAEAAVRTLERLAALGLSSSVQKAEEFAGLRGREDFEAVSRKLASHLHPRGEGDVAFTLRDMSGLIEGIAWREKTGAFYFGDVHQRGVWIRDAKGRVQQFTAEDAALLGVFALRVDEARGALWAACAAVAAMRGFTPDQDGAAAVAEIDLETGAVRRVIPLVRGEGDRDSHVLGDLTLLPDGAVVLTDSGGNSLWHLRPGGEALEKFVTSTELRSAQGIVHLPAAGCLLVSDYANGLVRIALNNLDVARIAPPEGATLVGTDGLAVTAAGRVLAIQNGVRPNRVLEIVLTDDASAIVEVRVLEAGHVTMADPTLGCLGPDGDFYFVGNAGWTRFEREPAVEPRVVPIFRTKPTPPPKKEN